jgi:5-methylcytosine-specific restriction protein A
MESVRGDAVGCDHAANGKDLHLFEYVAKGRVRYIGRMQCIGHRVEQGEDTDGKRRQTIQFVLRLLH